MLLSSLISLPIVGIIVVSSLNFYENQKSLNVVGLLTTVINLVLSLCVFILFHSSSNQFQYVQEHHNIQIS